MAAIARGERSESVVELHERLADLGFAAADEPDHYGDATAATVEAFQRARGLALTGEVDQTTWDRLIEAGWRLGQRLLFPSSPHLRGDDVADLQTRLAQLGFDPGRIDGIFGPRTESALRDFQRNRSLPDDATLTRASLNDLLRLSTWAVGRRLVTELRDLSGAPSGSRLVVVCGAGALADHVAEVLAATLAVERFTGSPAECAACANDTDAELALAFEPDDAVDGLRLHYWASYHSHSRHGDQLAGAIAGELARSGVLTRVEVTGMALPILRETRMTTLHLAHGDLSPDTLYGVACDLARAVSQVIHRQGVTSAT
ncbi:MAG TPA: peptidoglycan-binding protein [Acidimicrobiales bacterium]|nr:peptidoglycan-binding protein [Acidimicrobiales bacterium]